MFVVTTKGIKVLCAPEWRQHHCHHDEWGTDYCGTDRMQATAEQMLNYFYLV